APQLLCLSVREPETALAAPPSRGGVGEPRTQLVARRRRLPAVGRRARLPGASRGGEQDSQDNEVRANSESCASHDGFLEDGCRCLAPLVFGRSSALAAATVARLLDRDRSIVPPRRMDATMRLQTPARTA